MKITNNPPTILATVCLKNSRLLPPLKQFTFGNYSEEEERRVSALCQPTAARGRSAFCSAAPAERWEMRLQRQLAASSE